MFFGCLFIVLSLAGTALTYGFVPTLTLWWALPLAVALYVALGVLYIALVLIIALLLPNTPPSPRRYAVYHWVIVHTLSWIVLLLGFRVTLTGGERLPGDRPFLLVSNHRSGFDPLVTLAALKRWNVSFIAKPEIFRIPVIRVAMKKACFLAIDRDNARNAVTTIKQAAEQITTLGLSMAIYPEGTRNKASEALLPFHAGSFKIAKLANCPVVVITIRYEKRHHLPGKRVSIQVVDIMDEVFVTESNTATLSERAKAKMEENLQIEKA